MDCPCCSSKLSRMEEENGKSTCITYSCEKCDFSVSDEFGNITTETLEELIKELNL